MGIGSNIPPRESVARAALRLALVVVLAAVCGAAAQGCPSPRLPAVEGCTVRASRCYNDRPQVCSSTGRWHDVGDLACGAVGGVCVEGDAGVAHCGRVADGGAHD
jgi:hypothetical protein